MRKDYLPLASNQGDEEFVAEFWDKHWQDHQHVQRKLKTLKQSEEFCHLTKVIPGFESRVLEILDLGCGAGEWTFLLNQLGHRTRGLDIAPETIGRLREQHGEIFSMGDFRKIDSPENTYDVIINWGGIEHFEEGPTPSIQEAFRVLKPGGVFAATTPCDNFRLFLLDAFWGHTTGPKFPLSDYRFYQYRFTRRELAGLFAACGFCEIHSRRIGGPQGMHRCLQHEFGMLGKRLPALILKGLEQVGGMLLRPLLGHMVICCGKKPVENNAYVGG